MIAKTGVPWGRARSTRFGRSVTITPRPWRTWPTFTMCLHDRVKNEAQLGSTHSTTKQYASLLLNPFILPMNHFKLRGLIGNGHSLFISIVLCLYRCTKSKRARIHVLTVTSFQKRFVSVGWIRSGRVETFFKLNPIVRVVNFFNQTIVFSWVRLVRVIYSNFCYLKIKRLVYKICLFIFKIFN